MVSRYHGVVVVDKRDTGVAILSLMKPAKAMTVRLSAEQAEALETVATVQGRAISDVIRAAISEHIEARKRDSAFQDSLKERIDRAQRLLGGS